MYWFFLGLFFWRNWIWWNFSQFFPKNCILFGEKSGKMLPNSISPKKRHRKKSVHHTPCFFGCWIRFCGPFFPILYASSVNYDSKCGFFANFTEIWDFDPRWAEIWWNGQKWRSFSDSAPKNTQKRILWLKEQFGCWPVLLIISKQPLVPRLLQFYNKGKLLLSYRWIHCAPPSKRVCEYRPHWVVCDVTVNFEPF